MYMSMNGAYTPPCYGTCVLMNKVCHTFVVSDLVTLAAYSCKALSIESFRAFILSCAVYTEVLQVGHSEGCGMAR